MFGWMETCSKNLMMGIGNGIGIVGMLTLEGKRVGILVLKRQRRGHAFKVLQEKDKNELLFLSSQTGSTQRIVSKRRLKHFLFYFIYFIIIIFLTFFLMELPTIFPFFCC